ncbi:MAG: ribosome-associated translation inhibitor RaiA [Myxococcales bacterium]|nr:ribosome-associated translation inhibitor RaiA [Myxococcales bacterium]
MKCSVTFRHMEPSDSLRAHAEEKVGKLTRLIDRGVEAQVTLSAEKHAHTAHVELVTDGALLLRGVDKSDDLYASIDVAVDRIMRQVKRYREKIKNHRLPAQGREVGHQVLEAPPEEISGSDEPKSHQIVKQETIIARTMTIDDAVMQMDLLNTDFLVFTSSTSHQLNVLYRLPDGQFGLIEAHASTAKVGAA